MFSSKNARVILFAVVLLLITFSMYLFSKAPEVKYLNEGVGTGSVKYEKAKVLQVISEDLQKDSQEPDLKTGTQELEVKIISGEHKGDIQTVTNRVNLYNYSIAKKGSIIVVNIQTAETGNYTVLAYNVYKTPVILVTILLFFAVLWWIGGRKGLMSVLGIVFTFMCIFYLFIPMLYRGYSPIIATILVAVLITGISLLLLNGWSSKSWAAILGTIIGLVITGIIAYLFQTFAHISGYNIDNGETLITISYTSGMQLRGLLFAGVLLSSLGAVMDISISIAAAVHEVYLTKSTLNKRELYLSGLNLGRDIMGTMANTLLLAFTGSALNTLIILYAMKVPFNQLMNMNYIAIEVMIGMSGCIGIVLTVPIVAFISSQIIPVYSKKN
ncbi:YibE/F family protein [Cohnella endophytica]|uniref:YibE/F family protein n=1 Tax=Cohnella endophytica TaxID=2419778 RepID=A0A494X6Q5_9BACL|nr:YibE/F family protein [Cohnella endophytica]RKP46288.1 YibE/F family protein [Cohnella endophytica]